MNNGSAKAVGVERNGSFVLVGWEKFLRYFHFLF